MARPTHGRVPLEGLVDDILDPIPVVENGVKNNEPQNNLPAGPQKPERKPNPGWQTPPLTVAEAPTTFTCPHIGRFQAILQIRSYPLGAEWVCTCGEIFVVAYTKGGKRTLRRSIDVEPEDLIEPSNPQPAEEPTDPVEETVAVELAEKLEEASLYDG